MRDRAGRAVRGLLGVVVAVLGVACSAEEGSAPPATVTDSAGVRVVTYDLTDIAVPAHRVVVDHDLEIGVRDGEPEYSFSRISDVAVSPGGSLFVSDALAREIRVYDTNGRFIRAIGQPGEGPGEFANAPVIVGFAGDTVFAFDARSSRVTSFDADGELLTMITLRSETSGRPVHMIRQADGTYLSQSLWVNPEPDDSPLGMRLELDSVVVERLDASGVLIDTVLVLADRNQARQSEDAGGGRIRVRQAAPPFTPRAFLRSDGVRPIVGRNDSFQLHLLGPEGDPQTVLRVSGVRNPMTGEELKSRQEASLLAELGDRIDPLTRRLNVEFLPDRLQAFQTLVISADGDLWVALTEFDGSGGYDWLVFDPRGELRGGGHTPPDVTVFEIHGEYILGVYQDELDVSYLRRYPLASTPE